MVDTTENDNFDPNFEKVDSGASLSVPLSISDVKKGTHILMDGRPCKVVDIATSKTGKHGHAKANITGIDIFTGKKYTDVSPVSHSKDSPNINRTEYTILSVDEENYVTMIDKVGSVRQDLRLPNDVDDDKETCDKIRSLLEEGRTVLCTVLSAMKIEKIEDAKEATN